jgi:hypothetical protein
LLSFLFLWPTGSLRLVTKFIFQSYSSKIPVEFLLSFRAYLSSNELLVEYGSKCLFSRLFNTCFHPMSVVTCSFQICILTFFLYISPYFSVFQVGVQLYNLHCLLLWWSKIMEIKATSVKGSKYYWSYVIWLSEVNHFASQLWFCIWLLLTSVLQFLIYRFSCFWICLWIFNCRVWSIQVCWGFHAICISHF